MNELTRSWTNEEESDVERELEKLFILQDRALTKEKKAVMVQELRLYGLSAAVILAGMKKLQAEDLRSVKYPTIISAALEMIDEPISNEIVKCDHCLSSGIVLMRDYAYRDFALACVCKNGERKTGLVRWEGEATQYHKLEFHVPGKGIVTEDRILGLKWDTLAK